MAGLDEFEEGRILGELAFFFLQLKKKLLIVGRAFAIHLDRSIGYTRTLEIDVVVWSLGLGEPCSQSRVGDRRKSRAEHTVVLVQRPLEICRVAIF